MRFTVEPATVRDAGGQLCRRGQPLEDTAATTRLALADAAVAAGSADVVAGLELVSAALGAALRLLGQAVGAHGTAVGRSGRSYAAAELHVTSAVEAR